MKIDEDRLDPKIVSQRASEVRDLLADKYGDGLLEPHLLYALVVTFGGMIYAADTKISEETDDLKGYFSKLKGKILEVMEMLQPGGFPDEKEEDK